MIINLLSFFKKSKFIFPALLISISILNACHNTNQKYIYPWSSSQQMIIVIPKDWQANTATLRYYDRIGTRWVLANKPFSVALGQNGSAWGLGLHPQTQYNPQKFEGDQRSPAGIFNIGPAFGYAPILQTSMNYIALKWGDYCVDDPNSSFYNQIININNINRPVPFHSYEIMRRDLSKQADSLYKIGFVIQHNITRKPNAGSCIFAHLRENNQNTAGCTAMSELDLRNLLKWLQPSAEPIFVLLPWEIYQQKQKIWNLPKIKDNDAF